MSTSQPSPILIRTVSLPSFSSVPRSGTLMSPRATCSTTGCPTHSAYALSIPPPADVQALLTGTESLSEHFPTMVQRGYYPSKLVLPLFSRKNLCRFDTEVRTYCFFGTRGPLGNKDVDGILRA